MKTKFESIKQLEDKTVLEGVKHCFENSNELLNSALILEKSQNFSSALALLVLSVEELMKSFALFNLVISEDNNKENFKNIFEARDLHWERLDLAFFLNEFFKNINFNELTQTDENVETPNNLLNFLTSKIDVKTIAETAMETKKKHNNWLKHANQKKQEALYVAYNDKWFTPKKIDSTEFSKALYETNLIRDNISIAINIILTIDEKDLDSFLSFFKQTTTDLYQRLESNQAL